MIKEYQNVSIIYGGAGRSYAQALKNRIDELAKRDRYPIDATIIMESVMAANDFLERVIGLIKGSEWCVTFLTADDVCLVDGCSKLRLRQNVVMELGMALITLERERCILLCDFELNPDSFDLPSDMSSLMITHFSPNKIEAAMDNVIGKILRSMNSEKIPRYDNLLSRDQYYLDYGNLFSESDSNRIYEGKKYMCKVLEAWERECASLVNYDERCIFLLERLGFLPIFGGVKEADNFLTRSRRLIADYGDADIEYYGGTELLNCTKLVVENIIEYTRIKQQKEPDVWDFEDLLDKFPEESQIADASLNPLIKLAYYDYLGLTNLRIYRMGHDVVYLAKARTCFEKAMGYTTLVDKGMQLWAGFIKYNLARALNELGEIEEARKAFREAIKIRSNWMATKGFNITMHNAISYEYFVAKLDFIDMCVNTGQETRQWADEKCLKVERELDLYSSTDEEMDALVKIRRRLAKHKKMA